MDTLSGGPVADSVRFRERGESQKTAEDAPSRATTMSRQPKLQATFAAPFVDIGGSHCCPQRRSAADEEDEHHASKEEGQGQEGRGAAQQV